MPRSEPFYIAGKLKRYINKLEDLKEDILDVRYSQKNYSVESDQISTAIRVLKAAWFSINAKRSKPDGE